jgi:methionyl-tRNA formyltransferase
MLKVVVFGKGLLACRIAGHFLQSEQHELVAVVPSPTTSSVFASLADFAQEHGVAALTLSDIDPSLGVDIGFSCFFSQIFRQHHIDTMGRLVNLHNAPLPRYRGMRPLNWALKNGETDHGVTIHEVDTGIDTGPIISQCTFPVFEGDEVIDLYLRAHGFAWELFLATVDRLHELPARVQQDERATYYHSSQSEQLGDRLGFTRSGDVSSYAFPL